MYPSYTVRPLLSIFPKQEFPLVAPGNGRPHMHGPWSSFPSQRFFSLVLWAQVSGGGKCPLTTLRATQWGAVDGRKGRSPHLRDQQQWLPFQPQGGRTSLHCWKLHSGREGVILHGDRGTLRGPFTPETVCTMACVVCASSWKGPHSFHQDS